MAFHTWAIDLVFFCRERDHVSVNCNHQTNKFERPISAADRSILHRNHMSKARRTGHAALDIFPPLSITAAHANRCAARQMSIVAASIAKSCGGVDLTFSSSNVCPSPM